MTERVWLVYGPAHSEEELRHGDDVVDWTIHRDAGIGEYVLFYLKSPVCAIVASGRVMTEPTHEEWAEEWSKTMPYAASMQVDYCFNPAITYQEMKQDGELVANWGLIRSQMQSATGPQQVPISVVERLRAKFGLRLWEAKKRKNSK